VAPLVLLLLGNGTEEVILFILVVAASTVAAQFVNVLPQGLLDFTFHAFPHLGDLGFFILLQPHKAKPGAEGSSQLTFVILQEMQKPFVDACQKCIDKGLQ
jgi:hypothetical protein